MTATYPPLPQPAAPLVGNPQPATPPIAGSAPATGHGFRTALSQPLTAAPPAAAPPAWRPGFGQQPAMRPGSPVPGSTPSQVALAAPPRSPLAPLGPRSDAPSEWRGVASLWLTYPMGFAGFGMVVMFVMALIVGKGTVAANIFDGLLYGAAASFAFALYGGILAALLFATRSTGDWLGNKPKILGLAGVVLMALVAGAITAAFGSPFVMGAAIGFGVALVSTFLGQVLAQLLYRHLTAVLVTGGAIAIAGVVGAVGQFFG